LQLVSAAALCGDVRYCEFSVTAALAFIISSYTS
jgi:hypothetical protein